MVNKCLTDKAMQSVIGGWGAGAKKPKKSIATQSQKRKAKEQNCDYRPASEKAKEQNCDYRPTSEKAKENNCDYSSASEKAMRMIMFKKESGMDFGMQRPVEANSLQFSQIRIRCPHRRKDMMPTLFAALCQMSKMSRVHRVLEWVRVRFGICCLLVRCRGNVSPTPSPEWVGSEVWKLMASCQMSRTCQTFRLCTYR